MSNRLERGYGTTLGNSLRRILLSSLPGTAVTSIKIAGVQHEFSSIPGVKEDVTEIVLNVKGIIAKLHSEGTKTVYIEASGEGVVTAGDIKADSEVEILNPEHPIATLGPDGGSEHGTDLVPRQRLCPRRPEQDPPDGDRGDPRGLGLYPCQKGQLYGGKHPRKAI